MNRDNRTFSKKSEERIEKRYSIEKRADIAESKFVAFLKTEQYGRKK